jgi:G3E family GTPase
MLDDHEMTVPATTSSPRPVVGGARTPIPVTLLTGFLGSGKTTLLNRMLDDTRMKRTAVVINEFGSVSVDHHLVHRGSERYVVTTTGCLCCTATSDVRTSLFELQEMVRRGDADAFDRVIVESTGLADPAPIVNSLIPGGAPATGFRDHAVARGFRLANVIATFDAEAGETALDAHIEAWKQIAFADDVVITKGDLAPEGLRHARDHLARLNPFAQLHDRHHPLFDPLALFRDVSYSPTGRLEDVAGWLAMEAMHQHAGHDHDVDRHGDSRALQLRADEPLDPKAVETFLRILTGQQQSGLLRLKGLLALADDPSRPMVVHAVQHRLHPTMRLDCWPDADTTSRLVLIGIDLPVEPIRTLFATLAGRRRSWWLGKGKR